MHHSTVMGNSADRIKTQPDQFLRLDAGRGRVQMAANEDTSDAPAAWSVQPQPAHDKHA